MYGFRLLTATGLRRGDLLAIQPKRDIIEGVLYIRESLNGLSEITKGKIKNAVRALVINETCAEIIKGQTELLKSKRIQSKYLFPDRYGQIQNANSFYDR